MERWSIESRWVFHDREFTVSADVQEDILLVQVADGVTTDRWRGQFDSKHIEELTRKTGNYKKFSVFLNMLESAITKSSEAVTLDLLSYMDLQKMWEKKLGSTKKHSGSKHESKRYLILTYSVEFDRIHYPLALSYFGSLNPIVLQETVKKLQAELDKGAKNDELLILRQENALLSKKNEKLQEEYLSFKKQVAMHKEGSYTKEIILLKKVIKNMEEEALKEHAKHKKLMNKKNEEVKQLLQEIEDLQLSEHLLQSRVKTLTKELTTLRQHCRPSKATVGRIYSGRSDPRRSNISRIFQSDAKKSKEHSKHSILSKARTPSPSNARIPRFDPTAYIERKKKIQLQKKSLVTRSRSNSLEDSRGVSINRSRPTSRVSQRYRSLSRNSSCNSSQRSFRSHHSTASEESRNNVRQLKVAGINECQKMDISEIDARLNALQEFMKRSLKSAKNYSGDT